MGALRKSPRICVRDSLPSRHKKECVAQDVQEIMDSYWKQRKVPPSDFSQQIVIGVVEQVQSIDQAISKF